MSLEERLQALRNRYVIGAEGPLYFLMHKHDYADLAKKYGDIDLFMGVEIVVSRLAERGEPLAVVRYCVAR
jgi:hypothetical protein